MLAPTREIGGSANIIVASEALGAPSLAMGVVANSNRGTDQHVVRRDRQVLELLDVAGTAARLGVTVRFVRRLVAEERIPYIKVGKFIRFDPAEIERWIDERRVR